MRFFLLAAAAVSAAVFSGCAVSAPGGCCKCGMTAAFDWQKNLFLPEKIYAVPGVECNIYFKNIFLAVNHANFVFDAECASGAQERSRWTFTPAEEDAGKTIPFKLTVFDQYGKRVAEAASTICVAKSDAGKDKTVSILMIGDSLTSATEYPRQLKRRCTGSPNLVMVGTHGGGGRVPANGVAHEGYGGWKFRDFLHRNYDPAKLPPKRRYGAKSKFLFEKNGKPEFDFARYLQTYNDGKVPDVITIQLGVNDVFRATEDNLDKYIADILKNADALISGLRAAAPRAVIGIGYVTGGANQDAFAVNYKSGQTSWGYRRNHFRLNQTMAEHFRKYNDPKLVMIPSNINLDTDNNFPVKTRKAAAWSSQNVVRQNNGVHPDYYGYRQMGDSYYAWLKNIMPLITE